MTDGLTAKAPSTGASVNGAPAAGDASGGAAPVPVCFGPDDDGSIRHFMSLILHGVGIDTQEFADSKSFSQAAAKRLPDLAFVNVGLESSEAIEALVSLGKRGYFGLVQLMSSRGSA